jgi:hypothetical protein
MPTPSAEAFAIARAAAPSDEEIDWGLYQREHDRLMAERQEKLLHGARSVFRAMDGWAMVENQDAWQETVRKAADDLDSGGFLIERLGAERHLDPELLATLLVLRRRLIDEHGATTAAELMLIDVAVLGYFHTIRINGWIGNFAMLTESEFFSRESLTAKFRDKYGRAAGEINGLRVEDHVHRIGEELLPLLDRCNRLMLRNLKALKAMREPAAQSVSIGSAGQVNVAQAQVNAGAGGCERGAGRLDG